MENNMENEMEAGIIGFEGGISVYVFRRCPAANLQGLEPVDAEPFAQALPYFHCPTPLGLAALARHAGCCSRCCEGAYLQAVLEPCVKLEIFVKVCFQFSKPCSCSSCICRCCT